MCVGVGVGVACGFYRVRVRSFSFFHISLFIFNLPLFLFPPVLKDSILIPSALSHLTPFVNSFFSLSLNHSMQSVTQSIYIFIYIYSNIPYIARLSRAVYSTTNNNTSDRSITGHYYNAYSNKQTNTKTHTII